MNKEIIVDVRTEDEWEMDGHAKCSVNYPLDMFDDKIEELNSMKNITLVCRSGGRASVAKSMLINAGYDKSIENIGPWQNVNCISN